MNQCNALIYLTCAALAVLNGCSDDAPAPLETCDGTTTCDADCDGVVDPLCSVSQRIVATAGGELSITDGPLAGFSLEIPPGALEQDTEVSLVVTPGESLQIAPWDPGADETLFRDSWRSFEEILDDWDQLQSWGPAFLMEWVAHEGLGDSALTFDLQPSGLQFSEPATLTLPYLPVSNGAKELWPAMRIAQWSKSEPGTRILSNTVVDADTLTISADISHFSQHQSKEGYADALYKLGVRLGLGASLVGLPFLLPFDDAKTLASALTFEELSEISADLVAEMFCELKDESIDYSVPADIQWNELAGHLSTMPSLFTPNDDNPPSYATGNEAALANKIRKHPGPVSFAQSFHFSMELNGFSVFQALMTMHNLGRGSNTADFLEGMGYLYPSITDLIGAHYHMAGVALFHMFNDGNYQSFLFGYVDEVGISGAIKGGFDSGDMNANLIGSEIPTYFSGWQASCDPLTGQSFYCNEDNPLNGTDLGVNDAIVVFGTCNGFEREWHITEEVDELGVGSLPMVPNSCSVMRLGAEIETESGFEWSYGEYTSVSSEDSMTDVGTVEVQGMWTAIEGFVVDDQIPPQPAVGAAARYLGDIALAQADSTFALPQRWHTCDPLVVDADLGGFVGSSEETAPTVGVTNAGFIIIHEHIVVTNQSGPETSEDGQTLVTFDVSLAADPGADTVLVDVISSDLAEAAASPAQLSFNTGNWDIGQEVRVEGVDDFEIDGDVDYDVELTIASPEIWASARRVPLVNLEAPLSAFLLKFRYLGDGGNAGPVRLADRKVTLTDQSNATIAVDHVGSYTGMQCMTTDINPAYDTAEIALSTRTNHAISFTAAGFSDKTSLPQNFVSWTSTTEVTESVATGYIWRNLGNDAQTGTPQGTCSFSLPPGTPGTAYSKHGVVTADIPGIGEVVIFDHITDYPPATNSPADSLRLERVFYTSEGNYKFTWNRTIVEVTGDQFQMWLDAWTEEYINGVATISEVTRTVQVESTTIFPNATGGTASIGSGDSFSFQEQDVDDRHSVYPYIWF